MFIFCYGTMQTSEVSQWIDNCHVVLGVQGEGGGGRQPGGGGLSVDEEENKSDLQGTVWNRTFFMILQLMNQAFRQVLNKK